MDNNSKLIFKALISVILLVFLFFKWRDQNIHVSHNEYLIDPNLVYEEYSPDPSDLIISRSRYHDGLYGFWLGQCIANWTGLVTEMDKIGNVGEIKTGNFYTREDWGGLDQPNIFSNGEPSKLSTTNDFVFEDENGVWGADDDTDIEYIYQYLKSPHLFFMLMGGMKCFIEYLGNEISTTPIFTINIYIILLR